MNADSLKKAIEAISSLMTANTPQPADTVVPGAPAERRRIWEDDTIGVAIYVTAAVIFAVLVVAVVLVTTGRGAATRAMGNCPL